MADRLPRLGRRRESAARAELAKKFIRVSHVSATVGRSAQSDQLRAGGRFAALRFPVAHNYSNVRHAKQKGRPARADQRYSLQYFYKIRAKTKSTWKSMGSIASRT